MWIDIDDAARIYAGMLRAPWHDQSLEDGSRDGRSLFFAPKGPVWHQSLGSGRRRTSASRQNGINGRPHAHSRPTSCGTSPTAPTLGDMPYSLDAILPSPKDAIKGDIFILCPTTGKPVPTGLHTDTVVFHTLPKIEMRMRCPACQEDHTWKCTNAWVIESAPPS